MTQRQSIIMLGIIGVFIGVVIAFLIADNEEPKALVSPIPQGYHIVPQAQAYAPEATKSGEIEQEKVEEIKTAKVTAYSCGGLKTEAEIDMNCPSLRKYPQGRTSTGTTPRPYITAACDRANKGKKFNIEGVGEVVCEDTGGAIKGSGRFDLYVTDVQEARKWGVKHLKYSEVKN